MNLQQMAQPGQSAPTGGRKAAAPEQQEQFDLLLGRARQMLAKTGQEFTTAMSKDPVQASVSLGTTLLRSLVQMSEKAGQPVDPVVLMHVGATLVKDIAGIALDAGFIDKSQLKPFLKEVMQLSIAEYARRDADEGQMPAKGGEKSLPGDPTTPDDTVEHEGAESPTLEKQEMATEPPETGEEGMTEEDEMALQLNKIRGAK